MARQTTCARCGSTVVIRDDNDIQTLSCPRCLAPLAGQPTTAIQTTPTASTGVTETPLARRPLIVTGRMMQTPDIQAAHDSKRGFGCLGILIVLTIVGIGLTLAMPDRSFLLLNMTLFGLLDVLVLIQIAVWLKRRSARFATHRAGETILKVVTVIFAFLGLAVAVVVFLFFTCLGLSLHRGL
jgi:hypothetical protein